jgi:hypothetical protein
MRVLARAYGDRPLDRIAVGSGVKVVYIAAQSVASSMAPGESGGVGFPKDCVFSFDSALYESLAQAWEAGDDASLAALWEAATPLVIDAMEPA